MDVCVGSIREVLAPGYGINEEGCVVIAPRAFSHRVDFLEGLLSLVPPVAVEALLPIDWAFPWSMLRATVFAVDDIVGGLLAAVSPLCVAPLLYGMSVAALYQIDVGLFSARHGPEVLLGCFIGYCNLNGLLHCQGVTLCEEFLSDLL